MTNTDAIMEELEGLREEIEQTKTEKARAEGELKAAMNRLKSEFELSDEKQASEHLKGLQEKQEDLSQQLTKRYNTLKEKYDW